MTPEIKSTTTKTTVVESRVELTSYDLMKLLSIPENAHNIQCYVAIPGGGDWSNENMSIDGDCPVVIRWEIVTQETS